MNNSFTQAICQICGLEVATLAGNYKYSVFGGHTVVVEGHKGLIDYCSTSVTLLLGKKQLRVFGDNLIIKCLTRQMAVIQGNVDGVEIKNV